jgi:hypothetical protein
MAQPNGQELLAKIKRSREGDVRGDAAPEKLEQIHRFLRDHEATSGADCTHEVLSGYKDWWVSATSTKKLAIVEDNTLTTFYRHIATMYEMGFPLTLGEKRTDQFTLFQDIEIKGTKDERIKAEELIGENSRFMILLGQTMQELFSSDGNQELDVVIFDGSGECTHLGIQQTHIRLVWPKLVVDKNAAGEILDYIAYKFLRTEDPGIKELEPRMKTFHQDNTWRTAFADSGYCGYAAIRMPLNDNAAMAPLTKCENRALKPMGIYRFQFSGAGPFPGLERIATGEICDSEHTLNGHEWLKLGIIRRDAGSELTSWKRPTWSGAPPRRTGGLNGTNGTNGTNAMSNGNAPPRRDGGGVRIQRTMNGSPTPMDNPKGAGRFGHAPPKEKEVCIEREFEGSCQDFKQQLERTVHGSGRFEKDGSDGEGHLVWISEAGPKIEFRSMGRRVFFRGKEQQVRSLLCVCNFARAIQPPAGSVSGYGSVARASQRPGTAPSQAFAPRNGTSISGFTTNLASAALSCASRPVAPVSRQQAEVDPHERIAHQDYTGSTGEISLCKGDHVTLEKEDGSADISSLDRWVYGTNLRTQAKGWYPFAYTKAIGVTN